MGDDRKQVIGLRVAFWAEHPHEAFSRGVRGLAQTFKADGRVDVVAQNGFAGIHIAGQQALDALAQQRLAECLIALGAGLHGFLEAAG